MPIQRVLFIICTLLSPLFVGGQDNADQDTTRKTTFTFGGYAKLDWLLSRYYNGNPSPESPIRDIHIPSAIPVGDELDGYDSELHARETRFIFEVKSNAVGSPARMYLEFDFLLSPAGDERISNSYNPRLRHAFFEWKYFLFGQTWTTFMTTEALPDGIIFTGGADGLVFIRQALARISYKGWSFGFENPETTLLPYQESKFITSTGGFPDLVAKYTFRKDWGTLAIAGLFRTMRYANEEGQRNYANGYGLNVSGRINIGKRDDFRFMVTTGEGLGRYLAFQFLTGAVLDQNAQLETIGCVNGVGSFNHQWSNRWRSTFTYSFIWAEDSSEFTDGNANQYAWSTSASILFNPEPHILTGFQFLYANRITESNIEGSMLRLQFSARYTFDFSISVKHRS